MDKMNGGQIPDTMLDSWYKCGAIVRQSSKIYYLTPPRHDLAFSTQLHIGST